MPGSCRPRGARRRRSRLRTHRDSEWCGLDRARATPGPIPSVCGQHLEDDVSIARAVSRAAQRREAQGVGGVVDQIEPTFEGVRWVLGIGQAPEAGLLEPGELLRIRL